MRHPFVEDAYRQHCAWMLQRDLTGLFAAGGAGEFFSLTRRKSTAWRAPPSPTSPPTK